jgi:hypothetical protein
MFLKRTRNKFGTMFVISRHSGTYEHKYPDSNVKQWKLLSSVRASPIVLEYASTSWNEKWPPFRMHMQTQAKLSLIILHDF